ncbi:hypothetical protein M0802_014558 [Mischocyttarus mexicanus]|nr:hypothetical protein M0802_014558 [Mischocyttarus mexicanus]
MTYKKFLHKAALSWISDASLTDSQSDETDLNNNLNTSEPTRLCIDKRTSAGGIRGHSCRLDRDERPVLTEWQPQPQPVDKVLRSAYPEYLNLLQVHWIQWRDGQLSPWNFLEG